MVEVKLMERDVLAGRRENIYSHPGNVYFRTLTDKYAEEYITTPTQFRYIVTRKVMDAVRKRGGRFLKIENEKLVVCDERAASGKITKSLRKRGLEIEAEKNSVNTTNSSVVKKKRDVDDNSEIFDHQYVSLKRTKNNVDTGIAATASPEASHRSFSPGKRNKHHQISDWSPPGNGNHGRNNQDLDDNIYNNEQHDDSMWQSFEQNSERIETDASWNENYRRLKIFHATHGHAGVPINYDDAEFADWVSRQRQLFREIQSGYRIATLREEGRWKRLQALNFPVNYESWHWKRKYNELQAILQGKKYDENMTLPESLLSWLNHQRKMLRSSINRRFMDPQRREKLEKVGIN
jgi:hypothetical protein